LSVETRLAARKWFYGANSEYIRQQLPVDLLMVEVIYKIVLMFNKVSVVCLYYRIFAVTTSSFRITCLIISKHSALYSP